MRPIPAALSLHLAGQATTLCRTWRLTRRDGAVLGFTDHDRDLVVAGTPCRAGAGLQPTEAAAELGFAVSGAEVEGALTDAGLTEDDLAAGLYDGAAIETRLVNWQDPEQSLVLDVATLGEVRRADGSFVAETRGLLHALDEPRGRLYRAGCSADLGDARCGVDLDQPAHTGSGTVAATDGRLGFTAEGFEAYAEGWFSGGQARFSSGANAGLSLEVRAHRRSDPAAQIELWQPAPRPIAAGDQVILVAGCDRSFATCRARFANAERFRGFPHMPGNDAVIRIPRPGEPGLDGGSLFR